MAHEVFVRDLVAVQRKVILPDHCPRCKVSFEPGSKNIKLWALRPMFNQVRLTKVITNGVNEDVFETTGAIQMANHIEWGRFPAVFKCANCDHTLARHHQRTWILEAMDDQLAGQLRTLLYDSNVLDPETRKKVWGMMGYQGSCRACNMETELGTEEVPHPIDARVHTCTRNKDTE